MTTGHAEVGGVQIGGQVVGSGPALLLLHGFAGSWLEWQPNLEALSQHFKVYVPTMPGHGDSAPIPDYSLETARRLFLSFIESEGLERVNLAGHSMGGLLALDFALNFPERVSKLVVMDSAGLGSEIHWGLRVLSLPIVGEVVCDFLWPKLRPYIGTIVRCIGLPVEAVEGSWERGGGMARLLRTGVGLRGQKLWPGIRDQLPSLRVPTLIIWGERDPLFPLSQATAAHRAIPHSKLYILRGCGHCPGLENAEELNRVILEFLLSGE